MNDKEFKEEMKLREYANKVSQKEFNLSEKIEYGVDIVEDDRQVELGEPVIKISNIKEFIKREDNLLIKLRNGEITPVEFWDLRDKLVGKDLI